MTSCCARYLVFVVIAGAAKHQHNPAGSLLLATRSTLLLALARDDLAQHDDTVAIHEGDARQALAIFESIAHERLLWLETALRHLVRLQGVRVLHLLATGLFAHLPLERRDAACGAAATHEANRRVADLDIIGDIENLNLSVELARLSQGGVLLVKHNIARSR